jgi:hypothetical protein
MTPEQARAIAATLVREGSTEATLHRFFDERERAQLAPVIASLRAGHGGGLYVINGGGETTPARRPLLALVRPL